MNACTGGGVVVDRSNGTVRVPPRNSLARTGIIAGAVGGFPLFVVLYWLAAAHNNWRWVLVIHVVAIGLGTLAWVRHKSVYAEVTETQVIKQAFFVVRIVDRKDVASAVLVRTWQAASSDSTPQLLLLNDRGERLLRMRGTFWPLESMQAVTRALGITPQVEEAPLTSSEFFELHPSAAYWYENRPWIAVVGVACALVATFAVTSWIMMAIGAPIATAP